MGKGTVFDIRKYSIHDGPGIRTTVFLKGCPLRCWWCHNPEGQAASVDLVFRENRCILCGACVEACPNGAISRNKEKPITDRTKCKVCGACEAVCYAQARETVGRVMEVGEVMTDVEQDAVFYEQSGGGVTFSGGEPLAQREFLLDLLRVCKKKGIHTAVDTCGQTMWETFESIYEYVDLFMYDLKLVDGARHLRFTGSSNHVILENLLALSTLMLSRQTQPAFAREGKHVTAGGARMMLRVPIVPGINDDNESIERLGKFAASLPVLDEIALLPYHRIGFDKYARLERKYRLPETRPPSENRLVEIAACLREHGLRVRVGG